MITIADTVQKLLSRTPYLETGLAEGVINLSALARKIHHQIEEIHMEKVKHGSIVIAIRRYAATLSRQRGEEKSYPIHNITVLSDLVVFSFKISPTLDQVYTALLKQVETQKDMYVNFAQGFFEATLIASENLSKKVETFTKQEVLLERIDNVCAISFRVSHEAIPVPGVHYQYFRELALENINVVEVISAYSELTFIVSEDDADRTYSAIKKHSKQ